MSSYSKEVIRDLAAGTLPWPQTKRIMSAYKDDDRFFKIISVYQDRVSWKEPSCCPSAIIFSSCRAEGPRHQMRMRA